MKSTATKNKGISILAILFLSIATINYSCSNTDESSQNNEGIESINVFQKSTEAIVTISFIDGRLLLQDNQKNPYDYDNPEAFTTYAAPNGRISWHIGEGIETIAITIDSGSDIFKNLPKDMGNGNWSGDIKDLESGEAKYSIIYTTAENEEPTMLDPLVKISSGKGTNPPNSGS